MIAGGIFRLPIAFPSIVGSLNPGRFCVWKESIEGRGCPAGSLSGAAFHTGPLRSSRTGSDLQ